MALQLRFLVGLPFVSRPVTMVIEIATRSADASGVQGILRPFFFFQGGLACWHQMIEGLNLPVYRHFPIKNAGHARAKMLGMQPVKKKT